MKMVKSYKNPHDYFLVPETGHEVDFIKENWNELRHSRGEQDSELYMNEIHRYFKDWIRKERCERNDVYVADELFIIDN
jgi:hypothetical protein